MRNKRFPIERSNNLASHSVSSHDEGIDVQQAACMHVERSSPAGIATQPRVALQYFHAAQEALVRLLRFSAENFQVRQVPVRKREHGGAVTPAE